MHRKLYKLSTEGGGDHKINYLYAFFVTMFTNQASEHIGNVKTVHNPIWQKKLVAVSNPLLTY